MLPTTWASYDGPVPLPSASDGRLGSRTSAQVSVLAGICTTELHGTVMVIPLSLIVPPRCAASTPGHIVPLSSVVAWMKPVTSKPWMSATPAVNVGAGTAGNVGSTGGGTFLGGF